jgi:hypothetical protein
MKILMILTLSVLVGCGGESGTNQYEYSKEDDGYLTVRADYVYDGFSDSVTNLMDETNAIGLNLSTESDNYKELMSLAMAIGLQNKPAKVYYSCSNGCVLFAAYLTADYEQSTAMMIARGSDYVDSNYDRLCGLLDNDENYCEALSGANVQVIDKPEVLFLGLDYQDLIEMPENIQEY